MKRSIPLLLSCLLFVACASESSSDAIRAGGKADGIADAALAIVGDGSETRLGRLPTEASEHAPLRRSDLLDDVERIAALYDETFDTDALAWVRDEAIDEEDMRRGALFASATEREVRDDFATVNGVEWSIDELRAAFALAYVQAGEEDRVVMGDGETPLDAGAFHVVLTQLLAEDITVIRGPSDLIGTVMTGFEIKARPGDPDPTGPREVSREDAERILWDQSLNDAAHYYYMFASIETNTGFASEAYVIATDEDDRVIEGYWVPSNDVLPNLLPTRLWIGRGRPNAPSALSFEALDTLAAAFNETIAPPTGDTWEYVGDPVPFTENKFFCARVAMDIPERFAVGDIVVRATFSPAEGERWNRDLQISLAHAPAGNGPSIARIAGNESTRRAHDDQAGEWLVEDFNFEGSDSTSDSWELRVCDVTWSFEDDESVISGYVDSFSIEFLAE